MKKRPLEKGELGFVLALGVFSLIALTASLKMFATAPSLNGEGTVPLITSCILVGMIVIMLPMFFLAMYEKDGQPLEVIAKHFIESKFIRPKIRPYKTNNYYVALMQQQQLEKEVNAIVFQEEKAGTRCKDARKSHKNSAEAD